MLYIIQRHISLSIVSLETICIICLFSSECVHLLLAHNAPVKIKNSIGWTPLAEAISYGNRQTSKLFWYIMSNVIYSGSFISLFSYLF